MPLLFRTCPLELSWEMHGVECISLQSPRFLVIDFAGRVSAPTYQYFRDGPSGHVRSVFYRSNLPQTRPREGCPCVLAVIHVPPLLGADSCVSLVHCGSTVEKCDL